MSILYNICMILILVGAINWGLVAIANFDLVAALFAGGGKFGNINKLSRIVYGLVGISALYLGTQYFIQMMK